LLLFDINTIRILKFFQEAQDYRTLGRAQKSRAGEHSSMRNSENQVQNQSHWIPARGPEWRQVQEHEH